uniref:Helitron helicase-like domain-containing protein n=1 Tax=Fusarium oxysporum (strain Fo5176) TaxID=660025 RepID=A0A0D2YIM1_FUSOF
MASIRNSDFSQVEHTIKELTAARLEKASIELESSGKTADPAVNQLLRSLSLYGYRQPMSRESRLTMRRKIKSPDTCRTRETEEAEKFLGLDQAYKRARLAISDSVSLAIFFHRKVSMCFEHYVNVGEESVFVLVSQYNVAVETNERGALHLHGLLWLQGNMHLSTLSRDV